MSPSKLFATCAVAVVRARREPEIPFEDRVQSYRFKLTRANIGNETYSRVLSTLSPGVDHEAIWEAFMRDISEFEEGLHVQEQGQAPTG